MSRDARYELLVTLGRLGVYDLHGAILGLGGDNPVTIAAKRALGIGDSLLLERRAEALADGCGLPLEALDLGLFNWGQGTRATVGFGGLVPSDTETLGRVRRALALPDGS